MHVGKCKCRGLEGQRGISDTPEKSPVHLAATSVAGRRERPGTKAARESVAKAAWASGLGASGRGEPGFLHICIP